MRSKLFCRVLSVGDTVIQFFRAHIISSQYISSQQDETLPSLRRSEKYDPSAVEDQKPKYKDEGRKHTWKAIEILNDSN